MRPFVFDITKSAATTDPRARQQSCNWKPASLSAARASACGHTWTAPAGGWYPDLWSSRPRLQHKLPLRAAGNAPAAHRREVRLARRQHQCDAEPARVGAQRVPALTAEAHRDPSEQDKAVYATLRAAPTTASVGIGRSRARNERRSLVGRISSLGRQTFFRRPFLAIGE